MDRTKLTDRYPTYVNLTQINTEEHLSYSWQNWWFSTFTKKKNKNLNSLPVVLFFAMFATKHYKKKNVHLQVMGLISVKVQHNYPLTARKKIQGKTPPMTCTVVLLI